MRLLTVFMLTSLLFLSSCATTHESTEPVNVAPAGYRIQQLVVVAFTEDKTIRKDFEGGFAEKMNNLGLPTEISYAAMPILDDLDDEAKLQRAKDQVSADTSLLIEVVESSETAKGAQGAMFGVWIAGLLLDDRNLRSAGAWGGLAAADAAANYRLRVTLWNMTDNSLLWSNIYKSYLHDLSSTKDSGASLAAVIKDELAASGLIE
jgi:hypothetical protein